MNRNLILAITLLTANLASQAGSLANGQWQPANCGQKIPAPAVNSKSVEDFNQSIKDINAWQAKAQTYYNCVVTEANADNNAIAKAANAAQDEFKQEVQRVQKEAETGIVKVEKN